MDRRRQRRCAWAMLGVAVPGAMGAVYLMVRGAGAPGDENAATRDVAVAEFVGSEACRTCHQAQFQAWRGSDHDRAMQPATASTVLGEFNDARFEHDGVLTRFFRRDDQFMVETQGSDGQQREYPVKSTFGIAPLQQYLLETAGGRAQAFTVAWDARPRAEGGQRWFDLYRDELTPPGDQLHWTAPNHTWNFACAECHSTDLHKRYDTSSNSYRTTWSEINVACEACHGPGSRHVAIVQSMPAPGQDNRGDLGLALRLSGPGQWKLEQGAATAWLTKPLQGASEIEACGRCHSRRTQLNDTYAYGQPLSHTHRVALLNEPYYFPDGQIREEVFEYGSFKQSLMYARGVTCSDCHDPHSLRLRASGNALCTQCHAPAVYNTPAHHHHQPATLGASCVECHMPARAYMVVDPRRDHSIRIPRPDLSVSLGVPNACGNCHSDQSAQWAADAVQRWYGPQPRPGHQTFAHAFHAARQNAPDAAKQLEAVALTETVPAIARATAIVELAGRLRPQSESAIRAALASPESLLRRAAVEALEGVDVESRWELIAPLLHDDALDVRLAAATALSDIRPDDLPQPQRDQLRDAFAEYVAYEQFNADRAEHWVNLGTFHARQGDVTEAELCFAAAILRDPRWLPAYVNQADMYRELAREADAERVLREGLNAIPDGAAIHHSLGLLYVRTRRASDALTHLAEAHRLSTGNARFGYVYGMALESAGQHELALETWKNVLQADPNDIETLEALAAACVSAGQPQRAQPFMDRLRQIRAAANQ